MTRIGMLALPGCLHSAVAGFGEILATANALHGSCLFGYQVLSEDGGPVTSYTRTVIPGDMPLHGARPDMVILPPLLCPLEQILANRGVVRWLGEHHTSGRMVGTICAGAFLLAETGVLEGRAATTHWNLARQFRDRYPQVRLQIERLVVDGGEYICAGGVSAWMDLALYLVARHAGRDVALRCAKTMLMDPHREYQTPYGLAGFRRDHGDEAILRAQAFLETNLAAPLRTGDLAEAAHLGERTLLRRFRSATGHTPMQYLLQVRMDAARTLLETTDLSVDAVALAVGYGDCSAFRKVFKRSMGLTPSAYRRRFGPIPGR